MPTIYHNPKCSKSRKAMEILRERGVEADVVEYLKTPLAAADLRGLLDLLGGDPAALVRKDDDRFRELGLSADDCRTAEQVAALLERQPALMQRPVFVSADRAVIARPPERVLELL